ncbi:tetratricopeptide repeat protein [Acidocella sp.]|uniref:tetratricopeptide repeat protein n=1 Tax=Acidocella sp. TaxID=50710 RepID=UPI003CFE509F
MNKTPATELLDLAARAALLAQAEAGDAQAQLWLGATFAEPGEREDRAAAFAWCARAAEQGLALAQANLAAMYLRGYGVEKNPAQAVLWLQKAAAQEDGPAQFELGNLLSNGHGLPRDETLAASWYRRAASNGHYPAQARLGYLFAHGVGVEKDRVEAFLWLSLAARHGVGAALKLLEEVGAQMSREEKAAGGARLAALSRRPAQAHVALLPVLA